MTIPCLGRPEEDAADNDGAGNGLFEREADRLAETPPSGSGCRDRGKRSAAGPPRNPAGDQSPNF